MGFVNNKKVLLSSLSLGVVFWGVNVLGAIAQNPSRQVSVFDRAVEEVGGIRKGQVTYASFSNRLNQKLDASVRRHFKDIGKQTSFKNPTYSYVEVDINGDGLKDAFVAINNTPLGSGTGGQHTWVFLAKNDSYELVNIFYHQVTLVVLPSKQSGFQEILTVPGKIFSSYSRGLGVSYSKCSFNPNKKWESDGVFTSPQHYRGCQKVQQGSVISGTVIETSTFRRNLPEFSLL
jgi:hypothetical protein